MSSRREAERERDRRAAQARTNEYFVPKDGIDREVITADICRYLGNDALVRPGNYENPQTRTVQNGYFITAYRNLTTAMIADLKADSQRWEAERQQTLSRGQHANVGYRDSNTHNYRQHMGPTEAGQQPYPGGYPSSNPSGVGSAYNDPAGYQSQGYAAPPSGYAQPGYPVQDNYYVAGADFTAEQSRARGIPVTSVVPRSNTTYAPQTPTYQQQDTRGGYYSAPTQPVAQTQAYPPPQDAYYGRAVPATAYDSQDPYDPRYQEPGYSQPPPASSASIPAPSNTGTRRDRDREPSERESRSHRHSRR